MAIKSLVEIILTCGIMYILLQYLDNDMKTDFEKIYTNLFSSFLNAINFGSFGINCKIDKPIYKFMHNFVVVLQGVTSFILVILCFARYMAGDDEVVVESKNEINEEKIESQDNLEIDLTQ
ncbi:MAG: hypothetical protein ACK5K7_06645 [Bacilli bacterium]